MMPTTFDIVKQIGCSLPNVEATTRYDGSPVLKVGGVFMAGLATHASAEPDTLVVRSEFEERDGLLNDAAEIYYITSFYRRYPLVLIRLPLVSREAVRELLTISWRMSTAKCRSASLQKLHR
jgi:hypothetical protein